MDFADLGAMPYSAIQAYMERLPARMAELKLALSDVVSLPNLKQNERERLLKQWQREAQVHQKARPATPAVLKMMGIGVRTSPPTPLQIAQQTHDLERGE